MKLQKKSIKQTAKKTNQNCKKPLPKSQKKTPTKISLQTTSTKISIENICKKTLIKNNCKIPQLKATQETLTKNIIKI